MCNVLTHGGTSVYAPSHTKSMVLAAFCLPLIIGLTSSAAPQIDMVSPIADIWTSSRDVAFNVAVADTSRVYAFVDWENSLVGWWRGEGNTTDSSSSGNNGTLGTGATYTTGKFGQGFTGGDVTFGDEEEFDFDHDDSFTMSIWFYSSDGVGGTVFQKGGTNLILRHAGASGGRWEFVCGGSLGSVFLTYVDNDIGARWIHLAVVYDAVAGKASLFINGQNNYPDNGWSYSQASILGVGSFSNVSKLTLHATDHVLDEFLIFNRALSASEVAALYDATAENLTSSFPTLSEMVPYGYTVHAVNESAQEATETGQVTVDVPNTGPKVTLSSPDHDRRDDATTQTFTASVAIGDASTTLSDATLWADWGGGGMAQIGEAHTLSGTSDTASFTVSGIPEGTWSWKIQATDSGSNSSESGTHTLRIGQDTFYVAPAASGGDDANPGTISEPFLTIQHFADNCYPGDTCYVRTGTYRETVTPVRGGTSGSPIIIQAYDSERVTISGADIVNSWSVHSGSIYKTAAMTWTMGKGSDQVFVDGVALLEARWPNCTSVMVPVFAGVDAGSGATGNSVGATLTLKDADLAQADDYWVGGIIHGIWDTRYHAGTAQITASTSGILTATMDTASRGDPSSYGAYYIVGLLSELDSAGEFFYDGGTSTLYVWMPDSDNPSGHTVEAKARNVAFDFDGLSYITLVGVDILGANITTDHDSSHIVIDDIDADYVSHYTIIDEGDMGTGQKGADDTGIILAGQFCSLRDSTISYSAGNGVSLIGDNCTVSGCTITNSNYAVTECAAVSCGVAEASGGAKTRNNTITDNTLHYTGRSIVNHTNAQNLTLTYNDMAYSRHGWEAWDLGATYAIETDGKGTTIAYNKIHDIRSIGIYLDNGNWNFNIHHNLVWGIQGAGRQYGLLLNMPSQNHNVYNNTFADQCFLQLGRTGGTSGTIVRNNIAYAISDFAYWGGVASNNFLSTTDVQFVDAANHDFRLMETSPAVNAGVNVGFTHDIIGNAVVEAPDIGAYEYVGSSGSVSYTLSISSVNGTVGKSPDRSEYSSGESVTLEAVPAAGYGFVEWSGDLSGSSNPATLVMNGSKSVSAVFASDVHTLTVTASGGTVTKSPDKASYTHGETVTLTASANPGYSFTSWSGGASGTNGSVTVTMDADKSVTANFVASSYTLTAGGTNGSVVASPQKASYSYGETVSLQAVPSTGYHFTGWSGGLSGSANPSNIVMNANKSVTAGFAINTYTLTTSATNGSVVRSPQSVSYTHGATVSLQAVAAEGYEFAGWSGAVGGGANPASIVMDGNKSVTASFTQVAPDQDPPVLLGFSPLADAIQVPLNSLVLLRITDSGGGVDANTVSIEVDGELVYSGNVASVSGDHGVCRRVGTPAHYVYAYQPAADFDYDSLVTVTVNASDLADNAMDEQSYSFRTQMRTFGSNHCASWGPEGLDKGGAATACDASGNVWVVWHAGQTGSRDIYLARLTPGIEQFGGAVQLTTNAADQCNPDIAIGPNGKLYVVWQDNRRGNWDIYLRTSADGVTWSSEAEATDFSNDETNPVIAVDARSPSYAYVAWQDNRAGNHDIYVASSSTNFVSKTVASVASTAQEQTGPRIAVDASNAVYLVWTDFRNGNADVYGASSSSGPWTNVAVATGPGSQSAPDIAAEPTGSTLHFVWVSDVGGDDDVLYGSSSGLPASSLAGTDLIDDTSAADQRAPAIVTAAGAGGAARVFASWQDFRNAADGWDADLYAVEVKAGGETNLFVGDGWTRTNQSEPAIEVDLYGRPYVVWTDDRNAKDDIYFAASTFVEPTPLDVRTVVGATGGTVGVASPTHQDQVSVAIPAGACPYDVTVSVAKIWNLEPGHPADILPYEFGPSGLQFDAPVTITIPYAVADYTGNPPQPYWYDSMTGTMTQQGITNVEHVALSSTVHALRFQTTHFTPYAVVAAEDVVVPGGSGGGGGGCSLSPAAGPAGALEYFVPFTLVAIAMIGLRIKDRRRRSSPK